MPVFCRGRYGTGMVILSGKWRKAEKGCAGIFSCHVGLDFRNARQFAIGTCYGLRKRFYGQNGFWIRLAIVLRIVSILLETLYIRLVRGRLRAAGNAVREISREE